MDSHKFDHIFISTVVVTVLMIALSEIFQAISALLSSFFRESPQRVTDTVILCLLLLSILAPFLMAFLSRREKGSNPISYMFRFILESTWVRPLVGAHIFGMVAFFEIFQFPVIGYGLPSGIYTENKEMVLTTKQTMVTDSLAFRSPVGGYVSQTFSWYHPGVDIAGNNNRLVYPIASGKVVFIEKSYLGYGNNVIIDHGTGLLSRYAHLKYINVTLNQVVDHNTSLGAIGSTGRSTGDHLHLELYEHGEPVDPFSLVPDIYADSYEEMIVQESANPSQALVTASSFNEEIQPSIVTITTSMDEPEKQVADDFVEPRPYDDIVVVDDSTEFVLETTETEEETNSP